MPKTIGSEIIPAPTITLLSTEKEKEYYQLLTDIEDGKPELIQALDTVKNNTAYKALGRIRAQGYYLTTHRSWGLYLKETQPEIHKYLYETNTKQLKNVDNAYLIERTRILLEKEKMEIPSDSVLHILARIHIDAIIETWRGLLKEYGSEVSIENAKAWLDLTGIKLRRKPNSKPRTLGQIKNRIEDTSYSYATDAIYREQNGMVYLTVRIPPNPVQNYEGQDIKGVRVEASLLNDLGFRHESEPQVVDLPATDTQRLEALQRIWGLFEMEGLQLIFANEAQEVAWKRARALAIRVCNGYPRFREE